MFLEYLHLRADVLSISWNVCCCAGLIDSPSGVSTRFLFCFVSFSLRTLAQTNKEAAVPLGQLVSQMYKDQGIGGFYRGVEVNIMRGKKSMAKNNYPLESLRYRLSFLPLPVVAHYFFFPPWSPPRFLAHFSPISFLACVLNATKMGVYDVAKGFVASSTGWSRKDVRTAFSSSFIAGFFMTCTVAPWDMIRTKLMNQPTDKKIYDGFVDCVVKTVKADGVLSLWRGFVPIWGRFAPQATLQLLTIEFLYKMCGFKSI